MPLIQSEHAKGRKQAPYAAEAGNVVAARYEIDLAAATDVIELGILPAYCRIVDATLVTDGLGGAVTADVGVMSDVPGETTASTTVGVEIFDAADTAAAGIDRLTNQAALLLEGVDTDRAIGMTVSASATGTVILILQYAATGDY